MDDDRFDAWIRELDEDVIQSEYGYEDGEFTVYPEHWRAMFDEGLTPAQAFKRALDAFGDAREEEERERAANWARIQAQDAAAIAIAAQSSEGGEIKCRHCSVCEGQDHHWLEDFDEDTGEPIWACKHCDATKEYE